MGSIPLGANNFFSTEKCVCHLCDTIITFYLVRLKHFGYLATGTLLLSKVCLPRLWLCKKCGKMFLPDRESNPGLPRDRRRSLPLDYRGLVRKLHKFWPAVHYLSHKKFHKPASRTLKNQQKTIFDVKKYLLQVRLELTTPAFLIALSISTVR